MLTLAVCNTNASASTNSKRRDGLVLEASRLRSKRGHMEDKLHKVVEVKKPFKVFPVGTKGWVQEATFKRRLPHWRIVFCHPNLSGTNRHEVEVSLAVYKQYFSEVGSSPVYPFHQVFYGGWR